MLSHWFARARRSWQAMREQLRGSRKLCAFLRCLKHDGECAIAKVRIEQHAATWKTCIRCRNGPCSGTSGEVAVPR
jgi:hypothetical protein